MSLCWLRFYHEDFHEDPDGGGSGDGGTVHDELGACGRVLGAGIFAYTGDLYSDEQTGTEKLYLWGNERIERK